MQSTLCNLCSAIFAMQSMLGKNAMPKMAQNGAKMVQKGAKMNKTTPRWPKIALRWAKMAAR